MSENTDSQASLKVRLKEAAEQRGMSLRDVARETGENYTNVLRWISGETAVPADFVARFLRAVPVQPGWLLLGEGNSAGWREVGQNIAEAGYRALAAKAVSADEWARVLDAGATLVGMSAALDAGDPDQAELFNAAMTVIRVGTRQMENARAALAAAPAPEGMTIEGWADGFRLVETIGGHRVEITEEGGQLAGSCSCGEWPCAVLEAALSIARQLSTSRDAGAFRRES